MILERFFLSPTHDDDDDDGKGKQILFSILLIVLIYT